MGDDPSRASGSNEIRLQKFGLDDSRYERPNQKWVCGRLREGTPCRQGPDARGRCVVIAECQPVKHDDRWQCTRPADAGGKCALGPLPDGTCSHPIEPCAPVRSLRARRGQVAFWSSVLSLGLLIVAIFSPHRWALINPGPLSRAHAQLLAEGAGASRRAGIAATEETPARLGCANCHTAAEGGPGTWLLAATSSGRSDVEKCRACHFRSSPGESLDPNILAPHSLAPEHPKLQRVSYSGAAPDRRPRHAFLALAASIPKAVDGGLACATCHHEHRGSDSGAPRLTSMSDQACQVCHRVQFQSFSIGHPEFTSSSSIPARRGILFNHATHQQPDHFSKNERFDCARCHKMDSSGGLMLAAPFERACIGCHTPSAGDDHHLDQIMRSPAVVLIVRPDPDDPRSPPPLAQLLLATNDRGIRLLDSLSAGDEVKAADANAVLSDLITHLTEDESSRKQLVTTMLGVAPEKVSTDPDVAALSRAIAEGAYVLRAYQQRWLAAATPASRDVSRQTSATQASPLLQSSSNAAAWHVDDSQAAVAYRVTGHQDHLMKVWIDAMAAHAESSPTPQSTQPNAVAVALSADSFRANLRSKLFTSLSRPGAGGLFYGACLRCHSIEPRPGGGLQVNWTSNPDAGRTDGYTLFSHHTHLTALRPEEHSCQICHQPDPQAITLSAAGELDSPRHGFLPETRSQCITCHTRSAADESCLTCHQYHLRRP
jgi:hypothetical protein